MGRRKRNRKALARARGRQRGLDKQPWITGRPVYILLALTVAAWLSLRVPVAGLQYQHPDEPIATGVVGGVLDGNLDTNWRLHEVTDNFRYNQYNFSSYYLTLSSVGWVSRLLGIEFGLPHMRFLSILFTSGLIVAVFLLGERLGGPMIGLVAAVLTSASSQIFHDSLYARPESFYTLFTLLALLCATVAARRGWAFLIASYFILGMLLACKITTILLLPAPALIFLNEVARQTWSRMAILALGSAVALLVGAFLGAPYAFVHPDLYVQGFKVLMDQYSRRGGPLGVGDAGFGPALVYLFNYLGPTFGWSALVLATIGIAMSTPMGPLGLKNWTSSIVFGTSAAALLYTGTRAGFFERNFSHVLPILSIAVAFGIRAVVMLIRFRTGRGIVSGALLFLGIFEASRVTAAIRFKAISGDHERQIRAWRQPYLDRNRSVPLIIWPNLAYGDAWEGFVEYTRRHTPPYLVEFVDADDRTSAAFLARFECTYGAKRLASLDSDFRHISPSTLQMYLETSRVIYRVERAYVRSDHCQ